MQVPKKYEPLFNNPKTHNVISGGRGGAKTRTVGSLVVEVMKQTPLNIICGREIQKSLKESSFAVMRNEIYRAGYGDYFTIRESDSTIASWSGGRAVFTGLQQHTTDSIKSYEGFHWAWIEEAQSVSKKSLEVLIPTLRTDGWFKITIGGVDFSFPLRMFLYTLNPLSWDDPINLVLPESREDTQRITVNYYDNPWFPSSLEEERQEAKKTMAADEYLRIWEGIPYENAEAAILTRKAVLEAQERKASRDGGIVVGADIARFGPDRTVFFKREGMQVIDCKIMQGKDTQEVARALADFAGKGRIVIDDTGVGGGVTDKLRDLGKSVMPVNFGSSAQDKKRFPDVISEMWFNLAENINEIGMPKDNDLLNELTGRHFSYTSDERRKVESKKEYKKRSGKRSPDLADAMILCFYKPRTVGVPNTNIRAAMRI